jgi:uncharacterized OsmC-like protein
MSATAIATALHRVQAAFERRPQAALHEDAPALARWAGGLCVVTHHADGHQVHSDMPTELGGSGDQVTPGWLMRAGLASCTATRIAMAAATEGITLASLEAEVCSRSDARGLLGMADTDGTPVTAGPLDMRLRVRLSAPGIAAERLHALVQACCQHSPVGSAIETALPIDVQIELPPH